MTKNVVAIVQARVGSTRLPGKVLHDLAGAPMLVRCMERLKRAKLVDRVVVATTTHAKDDPIVAMSAAHGWGCFRGSEDDVLARYLGAAREHRASHVVRVTSDCPLTDPELVDEHVERALTDRFDLVTNMIRQTYPLGMAVEALPMDVLVRLDRLSPSLREREHVTQFIFDRPDLFVIENLALDEDLSAIRVTVDTPEDMELLRRVFEHFGHDRFGWREAVDVLKKHPEWLALNKNVKPKVI